MNPTRSSRPTWRRLVRRTQPRSVAFGPQLRELQRVSIDTSPWRESHPLRPVWAVAVPGSAPAHQLQSHLNKNSGLTETRFARCLKATHMLKRHLFYSGGLAICLLGWDCAQPGFAAPSDPSTREALLQAGHAACAAGNFPSARAEYSRLMTAPDTPPHYQSYAALRIAQSYVAEGEYAAAQAAYQTLQSTASYPPHHQWEAAECLRELERTRAGLPARDPQWSRVQLPARPQSGAEFFVAPSGADLNPGTKEKPFATLTRARDAIRSLKQKGGLPPGGVTVHLAPEQYAMPEAFRLAGQDSGTETAPILYRADGPGRARFTGGKRVAGFEPVTAEGVLARLPAEARGHVMELDLKKHGIAEFGEWRPRGFGFSPSPVLELFFNDRAMGVARWPNEGFVKTGKVLDRGGERGGAVFEYEGDRPARWPEAPDVWLKGYWRYLWADATLGVAAIDRQARRITVATPYTYGGGIETGMPYYVFNLLEEIDQPGEWYLDRAAGILYFWPPADPAQAKIELSLLSSPMLEIEGVSHVRFEGLLLELGRGAGMVIRGGEQCLVRDCVLRKLGGDAILMEGGRQHGVLGCELYELGRGGARVNGGERQTLTPGGHFVENCHIHDFSRVDRTYTPAVWMEGVSNRIAHNVFHDSPCHALRLEGNEHVIEFNEIHHVLLETDDQGGLDMFGNPTYRGNIIRYNYWHDLGGEAAPVGGAGVRLDDAICEVLVYGNVFYRCASALFGGVQIHGGKGNVVDNNLFVDCQHAISFSPWGQARWESYLAKATQRGDVYTSPLYLSRYPSLSRLHEKADVNSIWRNLVYRCGGFLTRDRNQQDLMDNLVTNQDPGFADAARQDFRLKPDAPVTRKFGFRPIPFEEIGRY